MIKNNISLSVIPFLIVLQMCTSISQKDAISVDQSYLIEGKDYIITSISAILSEDSILVEKFESRPFSSPFKSTTPNPFSPSDKITFEVNRDDEIHILIPSTKTTTTKEFVIQQIKKKGKISIPFGDIIHSNQSYFYVIRADTVFSKYFFMK